MSTDTDRPLGRRQFLTGLALAGTGVVLGSSTGVLAWALRRASADAAESPPEKTTIRLFELGNICQAPVYVAETFLQREGFVDVQYVKSPGALPGAALASGEADIGMAFIGPLLVRVDHGDPIVILAGVHTGCFELFGTDRVRAIRDLKGKTVAVTAQPSALLFLNVLAYVGLDRGDVSIVRSAPTDAVQLLAEGRIDAFMALPPEAQELRMRKIGHVLINTMTDRPWSHYFTGMIAGNRDFVRNHPVATKRALRAILKAAEVTVQEPARAAKLLVARGFAQRYDYVLQAVRETDYRRWRELEPADSVRFYSLRHHEAGMIKTSPNRMLAQGTDWRLVNELKKEMKA